MFSLTQAGTADDRHWLLIYLVNGVEDFWCVCDGFEAARECLTLPASAGGGRHVDRIAGEAERNHESRRAMMGMLVTELTVSSVLSVDGTVA